MPKNEIDKKIRCKIYIYIKKMKYILCQYISQLETKEQKRTEK